MKVVFAIPTITGTIRVETAKNYTEAILLCQAMGIETDLHIVANCPCLSVARDTLEAMFMDDPEATDHFWLDYDVGFDASAVLTLLQRPEEIIAGAYRVKVDDREEYSVVMKHDNGVPVGKVISENPPLALIEANFLATGFLRVKRSAYERMRAAYPELRYEDNVIKTVNGPIKEAYDLFGMGIDRERLRMTTEDYYFSKRWRDIGGQLWIYPDITFDHIGPKAYRGNLHQYLSALPGSNVAQASKVPGWMSLTELQWLAQQAGKYERIVEVGCWMGRSTTALAQNTRGTVFAVDTWQGSEEHRDIMQSLTPDNLFKAFLHHTAGISNIVTHREPSVEAARHFSPVGMVFIDASHDYENVKADIEAWMAVVTPGGLLCGHDYEYSPGVSKAVSELLPGASVIPGTDIWSWTKPNSPQRFNQ